MIKKTIAAGMFVLCVAAAAPVLASSVIVDTNIVLGLNLCRFEGKDMDTKFDLKAGLTAGALWSVYPADFFGLQAGLMYSQKGGIFKTEIDSGTLRTKMAFSYLEVPVVVKLGYLPRAEAALRVYVLGGASYGLKLNSRISLDLVQEGIETPIDDAKLDGYKSGGFNGIAGAGFEFAVKGGGLLSFEGRYSKSLATISSEGVDHRFTVFTFLAGYSF
jgi:Outer membrane protein beta-barrel domain